MFKKSLILIIALCISVLSGLNAFASYTKSKHPSLSVNMPIFSNGFALEKLSSQTLKEITAKNDLQIPDTIPDSLITFAKRSFLSEPTTAESLAIIALSIPADARQKLMLNAFQISKREQFITGWLISDNAEKNNLANLLKYYDISMRTSTASADILMPLLVGALSNDASIKPYLDILEQNPPWAKRFWAMTSGQPASVINGTKLRKRLYNIREENIYSDGLLIATLVKTGAFAEAIDLRTFLINNGRPAENDNNDQAVTNYDFSSSVRYPPIDWETLSTGEYGANISEAGLLLSAIPNSGGLFARQLIKLEPQRYKIDVALNEVDNNQNIALELNCAEKNDNPISSIIIQLSRKKVEQEISNINGLCQYYWLNIRGRSSEDLDGLDAIMTSVSIYRIN